MDLKNILGPSDENARAAQVQSTAPASPHRRQSSQGHGQFQHYAQPQSHAAVSTMQAPAPSATTATNTSLAPHKFVQRTISGPTVTHPLSKQPPQQASPLTQSAVPPSLPAHVLSPLVQGRASSPLISPVPVGSVTPHASTAASVTGSRTPSTPSMDTLADLASMQSHQPVRPQPIKASSLESIKSNDTPSRYSVVPEANLTSNPRASFDINMLETGIPATRVDFSGTSIPLEQQERLTTLARYLQENPSAYESHVEFITILHQGFIGYIYPSNAPSSTRDPRNYDLLPDLRRARDAMRKLYAIGETLWTALLQDEGMMAQTAEERVDVVEKFKQAVSEEAASVRLWSTYGDWVEHCYQWANSQSQDGTLDQEKLIGQQVFTSDLCREVWREAAAQTAQDIASGNQVWLKFLKSQVPDPSQRLAPDAINQCLSLFEARLQQPHNGWDDTFQLFSSFVSANMESQQYEAIMSMINQNSKKAKTIWADREQYEFALESAQTANDRDAEYNAFAAYIEWERSPTGRRKINHALCDALFQRAELRFPSDAALWEEHIVFLFDKSGPSLQLLARATKHCPWSGSLWTQYLLTSDRLGQTYQETENIKHTATSTGVLEAAGIEEVLKVHTAWCSYLRRRAFRPERDEDDADIAEIAMRTSLESMSNLGAKLGIGEAPDRTFRLQRIHINFLCESGRWDNARSEFDTAVRDYGNSYEFWMHFYRWEMMRWRTFASKSNGDEPLAVTSSPTMATAVLKQALDQPSLDYPEPIIQTYINHCEDHESADELQKAIIRTRQVQKSLAARRQLEAAQAAAARQAIERQTADEDVDAGNQGTKRKRETDELEDDLEDLKKSRNHEETLESVEQTHPEELKRDRENATILVRNLPEGISENRIRQFFTQCGTVRSITLLDDDESALVELSDDREAQFALSRDGQQLGDAIISVTIDTGSTVFVANYKPSADEEYIKGLLQEFGEIINVRLPSLQKKKSRRFCYVQFKSPSQAQAAVDQLDGKEIAELKLICKISNPAVKKAKPDDITDGRTIFVGGLNFHADEKDLEDAFKEFGLIERMVLPKLENNEKRNKGIAFITFSASLEAKAAQYMNGKRIKNREVKVSISNSNLRQTSRAPSAINGRTKSSTPAELNIEGFAARSSLRDRTVYLTNVPDIVNEDRIREVASKFGEVVKAIIKTTHQGAVIEYATVEEAARANLGLEGLQISDGRKLKVVTEDEMKAQGPEKKRNEFAKKLPATNAAASKPKPIPLAGGFIKRPQQPGNRKGPKLGGRIPALQKSTTTDDEQTKNGTDTNGAPPAAEKKSNDDFRAMLKHE